MKYRRHLIFKVDFLHMNASKLGCFLDMLLLNKKVGKVYPLYRH